MEIATILIIVNLCATVVVTPLIMIIKDTVNRVKHSKCACCDVELAEARKNSEAEIKKE